MIGKKFDSDAEVQFQMIRNTIVGKVDDNTAMISTEVFNAETTVQFMSSDILTNGTITWFVA